MTQQQPRQTLRGIWPKKGRLKEEFDNLAAEAGLDYSEAGARLDFGTVRDREGTIAAFETLSQRAGDALANLERGIADFAVVGLDRFEEARCEALNAGRTLNVRIAREFSAMSACQLCIATPEEMTVSTPADLQGLRIATSYPETLKKWLKDQGVDGCDIISCEGGVEDYIRLGVADVICDIVDSGRTLSANGLTPSLKLMDSAAVLVERRGEWTKEAADQKVKVMQRLERAATRLAEGTTTNIPADAPAQRSGATARHAL